jgi:hypothetical protein
VLRGVKCGWFARGERILRTFGFLLHHNPPSSWPLDEDRGSQLEWKWTANGVNWAGWTGAIGHLSLVFSLLIFPFVDARYSKCFPLEVVVCLIIAAHRMETLGVNEWNDN